MGYTTDLIFQNRLPKEPKESVKPKKTTKPPRDIIHFYTGSKTRKSLCCSFRNGETSTTDIEKTTCKICLETYSKWVDFKAQH